MYYVYGMKLRFYGIGCQPKTVVVRVPDKYRFLFKGANKYLDLIVYDRKLSQKEKYTYDLKYIKSLKNIDFKEIAQKKCWKRMNMLEKYEIEKANNKDHVATPRWVVEDIYKIIKIENYKSIWFPFNHYDSEFKLKADELNLKYKATHKFDNLGNDFFTTEPPKDCDLMISNPPFGLQYEIIKRSFELIGEGKIRSFALLLPLSTLETQKRASIYEKYRDNLSIIVFKKRIKFLGKTTSFNTACCWICYNVKDLPTLTWL